MKYILPIFLIVNLYSCVPVTTTSSTNSAPPLSYQDENQSDLVGMVKVFPTSRNAESFMEYPVIALGNPGFTVFFDLLEENYRTVNLKYIHCNYNWSPSNLTDLQYVDTYNEFRAQNYEYSQNTKIPYVSYQVSVPSPTKSGNYLLIAYSENNANDPLFTRRVMVYDRQAAIEARILQSSIVAKRDQNQQVEFKVNYKGIINPNPLQDFNVVILQNHNWQLQVTGLDPTLIRSDQNYLEYRHFNGENNFPGFNEFRFFDIRSIDFRGMNIAHIDKDTEPVDAYVMTDKSRKNEAYSQLNREMNGNFYLQNTDPTKNELQSEYVNVHFELDHGKLDGDIYVANRATNWAYTPATKLTFNSQTQSYQGDLMLKQGYYDYMYFVQSATAPIYEVEGSHWQTDNVYELFFYYRDPANNYDELIGYRQLSSGN